jgi:hypothetical protein
MADLAQAAYCVRGHQLSGGGWSLFPVQEIRPAKVHLSQLGRPRYKDRGDTMIAVRRGVGRDNPPMKRARQQLIWTKCVSDVELSI